MTVIVAALPAAVLVQLCPPVTAAVAVVAAHLTVTVGAVVEMLVLQGSSAMQHEELHSAMVPSPSLAADADFLDFVQHHCCLWMLVQQAGAVCWLRGFAGG